MGNRLKFDLEVLHVFLLLFSSSCVMIARIFNYDCIVHCLVKKEKVAKRFASYLIGDVVSMLA